MAEVEFAALSAEQAAALLGGAAPGSGELTLAEVFERRGDVTTLRSQPAPGVTGQYL